MCGVLSEFTFEDLLCFCCAFVVLVSPFFGLIKSRDPLMIASHLIL